MVARDKPWKSLLVHDHDFGPITGRVMSTIYDDYYTLTELAVPANGVTWNSLDGRDRQEEPCRFVWVKHWDEDGHARVRLGDWVTASPCHIEPVPSLVVNVELSRTVVVSEGPGVDWRPEKGPVCSVRVGFSSVPWLDAWFARAQRALCRLEPTFTFDERFFGRRQMLFICSCYEAGCGSLYARIDYDGRHDLVTWSEIDFQSGADRYFVGPSIAFRGDDYRRAGDLDVFREERDDV